MKVFFSTSVTRERHTLPVTQSIVSLIEKMGHEVLTKELVDPTYASDPHWQTNLDAETVYSEAVQKLEKADVLITECTTPSFGAGFFIDKALALHKPLLSIHWGETYQNASLMLQGRKDEINLQMYTDENVQVILEKFFSDQHSEK